MMANVFEMKPYPFIEIELAKNRMHRWSGALIFKIIKERVN